MSYIGLRWKPQARIISYLIIFTILFTFVGIIDPAMVRADGSNAGSPDQIILSWAEDPSTTQTIAWRNGSDIAQDKVQYLPAAGFAGSFAGAQEASAVKTELYAGYSHFEATLRGLTPATKYFYRLGRDEAWSEPASFTTASSNNKYSFLYMGDVQEGFAAWGAMINSAYTANPDLKFSLLGGDLVDDGNSIDEWQQFFAAATPVFRYIPLMPAVGNHDERPLFWNTFALPGNGPEGFKERFYSFDYGNCHIAVLDSTLLGASSSSYQTLKTWLQNDLNNSSQEWKFLVLHFPPYTVVEDGHAENIKNNWVPLFEQCNVDVAFVGHQHVYMRSKPLRNNQVQGDGEGIVYIMGNAGTKFYPAGESYDYIAKELDNVSNYQIIKIDGNTFTLSTRDAAGQVIDNYTLQKAPSPTTNAVYTITPVTDAAYQSSTTADGISMMTVNADISGMKYFTVQVKAKKAHDGMESIVFVHLRNGIQDGINVTSANFDIVQSAQAGFNVQPGDIVKAYIADYLTSATDSNPTLLQ